MTHIELALQATLLASCAGVLLGGALSYTLDAVRWIRRRLAERRERLARRREKWRSILS